MKKNNIFIFLLLILLVIISIFLFLEFKKDTAPPKEKLFFSDDPENWIYDNPSTAKEDIKIDAFMATEGNIRLEQSQQNMIYQDELLSFFYEGSYKGNIFRSEYLPDNFFNITSSLPISEKRKKADELALMQIKNEFDPNDGKIQGFILGKEENKKIVFYIFVDEDWKNNLEYTNIVWGDNFKDSNMIHIRPFDFSRYESGVYIDKLDTDVDWFNLPTIEGGIIVGEIDKEILSKLVREEPQNITYMMVR